MSLGEFVGSGASITKLLLHLNGDSTDSSGNGNNGTDTAITYSLDNGKFGQGSLYNGTTSRIILGDSATLQPARPFTISAWFNTTKTGTSAGGYEIIRKRAGGYALAMSNSDISASTGQMSMSFFDGSSVISIKSTGTYNDGLWHNIIGVWNTTTMDLYIDGSSVATLSNSSAVSYTAGTVAIGRDGDVAGNYWTGNIDEVILENYAWSAAQIKKYYTYAKGRFGIT